MVRSTQIFQVSTLYGAATLAAALDAGQFGPHTDARRLLLISNNAAVPEVATRMEDMQGYSGIAARFDRVIDWNAAIAPHHPSAWAPRGPEAPMWERMLRHSWDLGDGRVELAVESVHAGPGRAITAVFAESAVHVYADGLMSYGPTRQALPQLLACRIQRLLHLDLVPGLRPLLLSEYEVEPELVPAGPFRAVLAEMAATSDDPELDRIAAAAPTAFLLGQYLAALGILTADEEEELHIRMLHAAAAAGHSRVLFKPHPTAPARYSRALDKAAADACLELTVPASPVLAEVLFERCRPELVVGCFSTAMLTAATLYDIPVATEGTGLLLDRLEPYANSNRVPVTIVDATVPGIGTVPGGASGTGGISAPGPRPGAPEELGSLVRTVGYCMQPQTYPWLRAEAEQWLRDHLDRTTQRYFDRSRLGTLGLPGGSRPRAIRTWRPAGIAEALRAAPRRAWRRITG